jgi:hypothetical protein
MCNPKDVFLFLASILLAGSITGCRPFIPDEQYRRMEDARTREADELIAKSDVLQKLEQSCKEIPLFAGFEFQTKRLSSDRKLFLGYGYKSSASYGEVRSFYESYFKSDGWSVAENSGGLNNEYISFFQSSMWVTINHIHDSPREDFVIECGRPTSR